MDFELTAEQNALRARARELADGVFAERAARWDEREEYPWDNVKDLAAAGFMGMTIPREYGGGDRPLLDVVLVIEEIAVRLDAARLLIHRAAARADRGFPDPLEAAKAKTFTAEMAQAVTSEALQIHGAAGYGRSLPLERMVRDARMFAIGGGTLEMMRNLIADGLLARVSWRPLA